jgi:hypothetical protein
MLAGARPRRSALSQSSIQDSATRYDYLHELAWSLEGVGVELLVDPGPRGDSRPAYAHPTADGLPAAARRGTPLHKAGADGQATSDIVMTPIGLLGTFPIMLAIAAGIKL